MKKGTVEITRKNQYTNKLRSIGVYINNKKIGKISDGETMCFDLDCIDNEIYVKIDWCKTKPLKINTKENETTKLELGSNVSGWKMLIAIWYIIFETSKYLYLRKI